jgi:tetratricopeptide (TPR) repeat protein
MQYTVEKLNPLAFAKSQALTCELTGRPALFSLVVPSQLLTLNFVSRELAQQAWDGILCRIARELGQLLSPPPLASSEKERLGRFQAAQARKHALIEVCEGEAKRHIVHSRFELAIPAAMYALRFGTSIYGEGNVELVPAFLLLAEANLGLLNFAQAEEFLTKANWSLLKSANSSNALRSQLRRNFGKLYAAQGKYEEALRQLADDVYYSSLMVGPEHIDTSGGLFQLANVFFSMNQVENALAMYDKVVDIWYKCLAAVLSNGPGAAQPPALSDAKGSEGIDMLGQILRRREECVGETNIATGESYYILGLLQQYMQQHSSAATCIRAALAIYQNQLGPEHRSTKDVATSLAQLESSSSSADS